MNLIITGLLIWWGAQVLAGAGLSLANFRSGARRLAGSTANCFSNGPIGRSAFQLNPGLIF